MIPQLRTQYVTDRVNEVHFPGACLFACLFSLFLILVVALTERIGFGYGASIAPVGTSSIAIQHGSDLMKFDGKTGEKLQVTRLKSDAENISAVKLSNRPCVAVYFSRYENRAIRENIKE